MKSSSIRNAALVLAAISISACSGPVADQKWEELKKTGKTQFSGAELLQMVSGTQPQATPQATRKPSTTTKRTTTRTTRTTTPTTVAAAEPAPVYIPKMQKVDTTRRSEVAEEEQDQSIEIDLINE